MRMNLRLAVVLPLLLAMPLFSLQSIAQCTPDQSFVTADQMPKTWKTGCVGQPYSETVHISFPVDSVISGVNVVFDHFEVLSTTLPPGLSYSCNVSNCKWTPSNTPKTQELMFGCIQISGTPQAPFNGQVTFDIEGCGTVIIITQCETEVIPFNLTILDPPAVSFSSQINQNTVSFVDQSTSGGTISNWNWSFGDGSTSTQQNPSHTYASSGSYNVCLSVVSDGCSSQSCETVEVVSVDVDPAAEFARQVNIFPNPASVSATLRMQDVRQARAVLRSMDGRTLRSWQFAGSSGTSEENLSLQGIANGMYFLDIQSNQGSVVKKLIVRD